MFYPQIVFISLVATLGQVHAAEVDWGLDDEVVENPFEDAVVVDSCDFFSIQRSIVSCATATLENRPPLGACKTSDIERLAKLKSKELPPFNPEIQTRINEAFSGFIVNDDKKNKEQLLSVIPEFSNLIELNTLQGELSSQIDPIMLNPKLSDEQKLVLYEPFKDVQNELWEKNRTEQASLVDRVILVIYSYCMSGSQDSCNYLDEIYDVHGWLLRPETTPAYCEFQDLKVIRDSVYVKRKLSLAQLLNKPAVSNENGPIKLYSHSRMYSAYLDDNESSDVYMKLSEELLKVYKDTDSKNTDKLKETALALTTSTNGYFQAYFPEYFTVSERACDDWGMHQTCYELARAYRFGLNTPENHYLAEEYYLKAIELMPNYAAAYSELANMQLDIKSPVFNADKAITNLNACVNSIYCPSTLGFVYVSKLYNDKGLTIDERIKLAEELWLSELDSASKAHFEKLTFDKLLEMKPMYDFAYTSPSHYDESVFKSALAGHKKAQLLLAQGFFYSIPSNLLFSPTHSFKWILLAEQDFAKGLSDKDREALHEMKNILLKILSPNDLKRAHKMATEISRYALEKLSKH
jgi:hypothetical protein